MTKRKLTANQRGYDYRHQRIRKQLEPIVKSGQANCWRCGYPIKRDEDWDLGHADERNADGSRDYRGPEHVRCNRATHNRRANARQDNAEHYVYGPPVDTSRPW